MSGGRSHPCVTEPTRSRDRACFLCSILLNQSIPFAGAARLSYEPDVGNEKINSGKLGTCLRQAVQESAPPDAPPKLREKAIEDLNRHIAGFVELINATVKGGGRAVGFPGQRQRG